jgi:hypothetical protein
MKINIINALCGIINSFRFDQLPEKDALALWKNYIALRKAAEQADKDRDEIVKKFQQDWKDELAAVQAFRDKKEPVVGHDAYLEAEKVANAAIGDLFSTEVDITLVPVKIEAFKGIALTFEQLAFLSENGIIEA